LQEISKLEDNLNITIQELNDERDKYAQFQEFLNSEKHMKQKV